jgi:hypothetical protein
VFFICVSRLYRAAREKLVLSVLDPFGRGWQSDVSDAKVICRSDMTGFGKVMKVMLKSCNHGGCLTHYRVF